MRLPTRLLAGASMLCLMTPLASGQNLNPVGVSSVDGATSRAFGWKVKKPTRSRTERAEVKDETNSTPAGHTNFDVSAVEADRAKKAATLASAEREKTAHLRPGMVDCVIKPVMTNAEIARCRSN